MRSDAKGSTVAKDGHYFEQQRQLPTSAPVSDAWRRHSRCSIERSIDLSHHGIAWPKWPINDSGRRGLRVSPSQLNPLTTLPSPRRKISPQPSQRGFAQKCALPIPEPSSPRLRASQDSPEDNWNTHFDPDTGPQSEPFHGLHPPGSPPILGSHSEIRG